MKPWFMETVYLWAQSNLIFFQYTVSALTYAVRGGHEQVVEYLLKVNDMIRTVDVVRILSCVARNKPSMT